MNNLNKLRIWQLNIQILAVTGMAIYWYEGILGNWLWVSLFFYCFYGVLGSNLGYHRLEAHHSFKTYAPIRYFLIFCGMLNTNCSPLAAVMIHRSHHKYTDKKRDPHSPITMGVFKAYFNDWFVEEQRLNHSLAREELKDPFYILTHKWYIEILVAFYCILFFYDFNWLLFGYVIPAAMLYHAKGIFNVMPHMWGYRNFDTDDQSKNNWIMHILTLGDGMHNNHHAQPSRWDTRVKWYEIDPSAWIIKLIKKD